MGTRSIIFYSLVHAQPPCENAPSPSNVDSAISLRIAEGSLSRIKRIWIIKVNDAASMYGDLHGHSTLERLRRIGTRLIYADGTWYKRRASRPSNNVCALMKNLVSKDFGERIRHWRRNSLLIYARIGSN